MLADDVQAPVCTAGTGVAPSKSSIRVTWSHSPHHAGLDDRASGGGSSAPESRASSTGKSLVNKILRHVLITDAHQDSTKALISGPAIELREVAPLGAHTYSTHNRRPRTTRLVPAARRSARASPPLTRFGELAQGGHSQGIGA